VNKLAVILLCGALLLVAAGCPSVMAQNPTSEGTSSQTHVTTDVKGFPKVEEGWGLYGATVTMEDVYPGYVNIEDKQPIYVTIVNGKDKARIFHLSLQQPGKSITEGYEPFPTEYFGWIAVDKQPVSDSWTISLSNSGKTIVCHQETNPNYISDVETPNEPRTITVWTPQAVNTYEPFSSETRLVFKTLFQGQSPPQYGSDNEKAVVGIIWADKTLDQIAQETQLSLSEVMQAIDELASLNMVEQSIAISRNDTRQVPFILSVPDENFPKELKGQSYDVRILVEDWTQTGFTQVAHQEKWLMTFAK
jgi:hypothetical protein